MTTLGPSTDYTGAAVTQGGKKTFIAAMRALIADRLGVGYNLAPENVASASNVDLSVINTRQINLTGTTTVDTVTAPIGLSVVTKATGAITLKAAVTGTGADILVAAGDTWTWRATAADTMEIIGLVRSTPADRSKIQPITASVAANALTVTLSPTSLDFRSTTAGSGAVTTVTNSASVSVVVSSGSTLGSVSAVATRLAVVAINNAGAIELAVINPVASTIGETGVITTVAEGGAGAADSADVYYSTAARTNVACRVVGFVEYTQATAGTYATAPSKIQGASGGLVPLVSLPFSASYASPNQTITLAGALSLTHSLGGMPTLVQTRLKCVTAEGGYSIGDEVIFNAQGDYDGSAARGISVVPTSTTVEVRYSSNGFQIVRKDTGGLLSITAANWSLIVRAWR